MEDEQAAIDAVLKFAVLALVIGALLGLATFVGVKMLGLNGGGGTSGDGLTGSAPSALPTTALTDSTSPSASPSEEPSASDPPSPRGITLSVAQGDVAPGERITFNGQYPGAGSALLAVQRKEGGTWTQFANVTVPVRSGRFSTYIITARTGTQKFRVYDSAAGKASNAVTVTVGG